MTTPFRFAHISDLHFGSFSLSPLQFFSKRFVGNFNFLLNRRKAFAYNRLIDLIDLFKKEGVTHIFITGDFSVTSRKIEFSMGKNYLDLLRKEGFTLFTVPGNHDHYTKRSHRKKTFYRFFDKQFDPDCPLSLKKDLVTYTQLVQGLWVVALDTATATPLYSAEGHFSPEAEESLEKAFQAIPKEDTILLMNHFPLFTTEKGKNSLVRAPLLKSLLAKNPNILLYLHGHSHRQAVADLRPNQLPIISDCGSTPHRKEGACHLFTLEKTEISLDVYRFDDEWKKDHSHTFERA
ncbi:MAG: 3',5'-cyclic adenosine monophosphate phosphodiesterase CpdA [Chlamydiae bacterium]|nr:3',5'-cyclic adenosine monophosphate phosphodiesterase CpdA [Chlamydiota bacterium]